MLKVDSGDRCTDEENDIRSLGGGGGGGGGGCGVDVAIVVCSEGGSAFGCGDSWVGVFCSGDFSRDRSSISFSCCSSTVASLRDGSGGGGGCCCLEAFCLDLPLAIGGVSCSAVVASWTMEGNRSMTLTIRTVYLYSICLPRSYRLGMDLPTCVCNAFLDRRPDHVNPCAARPGYPSEK